MELAQTGAEFAAMIRKLHPSERVAVVREKVKEVALKYGLKKDKKLSWGGRWVYMDPNKKNIRYSLDTQHGTFEVLNLNGDHLAEVNFDFKVLSGPDKSGAHNLKIK